MSSQIDYMDKKTHNELIKVCFEIARKNKGALIVVGTKGYSWINLEENKLPNKLFTEVKDFTKCAKEDGAIILNHRGKLIDNNVQITGLNNVEVFKGFGTRHATALAVSKLGNTCYAVSEQKNIITLFKNGIGIGIPYSKNNEIKIIKSFAQIIGYGTLTYFGLYFFQILSLLQGITLTIIIGGGVYTIKKLQDWKIIK